MDDDKVHVLDSDGQGTNPKPLNPARRWLLAAATVSGLFAAVLIIVLTQTTPVDPSTSPAETSSPAAVSLPSTTVWRGVTYSPTVLQSQVRSFCEQVTAVGPGGLRSVEESRESPVSTAIIGVHGFVVDHIAVEATHARNAQDLRLASVLESVSEDLTTALAATLNATGAVEAGALDEWTYQMFRAERFCGRADGTISTLVPVGGG